MADSLSYEACLKRLEELVNLLESGKLSLEDSIAAYEEGKRLSQSCMNRLKDAQKKIQLLLEKEDGSLELSPLNLERQ